MAPLLVSATNYGFEQRSYTWFGLGLWAQLWGMFLLPIALGLTWRALRGRGSLALAALVVWEPIRAAVARFLKLPLAVARNKEKRSEPHDGFLIINATRRQTQT